MIKPRLVLLSAALLALSTVSAQAEFTGSLGLSGIDTSQNGDNLGVSTVFGPNDIIVTSSGEGGFEGAGVGLSFGSLTLDLEQSDGFGFLLHNEDWGTFTATAGRVNASQVPDNLYLHVTGDFVGSGNTAGESGTFSAIITFSQNIPQNGGTLGNLTQNISISVPAAFNVVPEPSSVALSAIGLVSLGLIALRRRSSN